ncbi:MAG TPA: calcium-binding protein [Dehalococcoidia bacterium]|nr:calcium-binding protein [Dehalococcoidia bacterium]
MRALLALLAGGLVLAVIAGYAAANNVPPTRLDNVQARSYAGNDAQKAQDFAPLQCASIRSSLQRIVYIGGTPGSPGGQSELVLGTGGNNSISAGGGNDCVLGGGGNDTLSGGGGDDVILGGPGADSINGGIGDDILYGGPGNDSISGGSGDDLLVGQEGSDNVAGDQGTDTCYGEIKGSGCETFIYEGY